MRVVFSPEARQEFEEVERYYNRQAPQLGSQFRREIRAALPRIRTWSLSCQIEQGEIRRLTPIVGTVRYSAGWGRFCSRGSGAI